MGSGICDLYTKVTIHAVVDTVLLPNVWNTTIHEYVISVLDQTLPISIQPAMPFSTTVARLLDIAAIQFLWKSNDLSRICAFPRNGIFSTLSRSERLMVLTIIEKLELPMDQLPAPFTNNPGLTKSMKNTLTQLTTLGYYSEWTGYGLTRMNPPDFRRFNGISIGWAQTQYPGPAFGYRDFREYSLYKGG